MTDTDVQTAASNADFWERVLISFLGTLGSLLIALLIFGLTRWADRRRARKEVRVKNLSEFSDSLGLLVHAFLYISTTRAGENELFDKAIGWVALSFRFRVALGTSPVRKDFERFHNELGAWIRRVHGAFEDVRAGRVSERAFGQANKPVIESLNDLHHNVNVLIVRLTLGRREAMRVQSAKPLLDESVTVSDDRPAEGANGWQVISPTEGQQR